MAVYNYFKNLTKTNDMSISAHVGIACFLTASYTTMLAWLKSYLAAAAVSGPELVTYWHGLMERSEGRAERERFFSEVVKQANNVSHYFLASRLDIYRLLTVERTSEAGTQPQP